MELGGTCGLQFGQKMNTVEALKTDGARRKTTAGDMGILYFRETNKLYSTEMDNKSVQKKIINK